MLQVIKKISHSIKKNNHCVNFKEYVIIKFAIREDLTYCREHYMRHR